MPVRRVAAAVAALQVAALVVAAVGVLVELVQGRSDSVARAVSETVLALVVAAGLAALAVAWRRAPDRARTPALVWHVLLVPVVISLFQSAQALLGTVLGAVALVGLVSAGLGGASEDAEEGGSEAHAHGVAEDGEDEPQRH